MAIQHTRDTDRGKGAARKRWTAQSMGQELDALVGSSDSATLQRAVMDPRVASPADILALQRSFGNEAVSGLIQAKLTVGPAGDQYEQEADRVAQQVMSIPAPGSRPRSAVRGQPGVQRQEMEEEEELQMKRVARQPLVQRFVAQRQAPEEEEELQLKAVQRQPPEQEGTLMMKPIQRVGPEGGPVPEEVRSAINRALGAGHPLEGPVQEQMSAGMGHDFRGVRVHTDSEADVLNQQLSARAFTTGQDIFFRQGEYQPGASSGRELIAHELSHVVQQSTGQVSSSSGMTVRPGADAFEQEAEAKAMDANKHLNKADLQRAVDNPGIVQRELTQAAIDWLELRKDDEQERRERGRSLLDGSERNLLAHVVGNCHETVWFVSRLIQGAGVAMIKGPASEPGKVGGMYGAATPWNGGPIPYGTPVGFKDLTNPREEVAGYFHSAIAIGQGAQVKGVNGLSQLGNGWQATDLAQLPQTNGQGPSYRTVEGQRQIQVMIGR